MLDTIKIIPSVQTSIDDTNPTSINAIFVICGAEQWGMHQYFKPFNAVYDGDGWWIDLQHQPRIVELCEQKQMFPIIAKLPANSWENFRRKNLSRYIELQLSELHIKIEDQKKELGVKYPELINKAFSLTDEQINELVKSDDGKKLIQRIEDFQKTQIKLLQIKNEETAANAQPQAEKSFDYLLKMNSEQELIDELKNITPGISTGYQIGEIDLAFPGGAISIIAAPTSHGKTTALINFCLGVLETLEKNPTKCVYLFTYEESTPSILSLFINTWVSKKLSEISSKLTISKNNRKSIDSYFRGIDEYISKDTLPFFLTYKNQFFEKFIDNGRLRVVYSDIPASELVQAIRYIKSNTDTALVCIDYMQLLTLNHTPSKLARQEELKQICLQLKDCAIDTGLPIVLTAQFNRTVVTEGDLSCVNIGEAGDIERVASLIIGMFNRNFEMIKGGNENRDGEKINKESAIYFEVLKGRGIGNGHSTIMSFDGNQGVISQQADDPF